MPPEVIQIVFDALHKGRLMRQAQRTYFRTRSVRALSASLETEAAFDVALEEAIYAVKHGSPRPQQQCLAI